MGLILNSTVYHDIFANPIQSPDHELMPPSRAHGPDGVTDVYMTCHESDMK